MTLLLAPHGHDQVVSMRLRGVTLLSLRSRHGRSISSTADIVLRTANLEDMFLQWRLARTLQCFGYHPTKRAWYIFPSSTSTTTIDSGDATTAAATISSSTTAIQLATPNEYQYNYDVLIYGPNGNTDE
eukprot:scaffold9798_cov162-Skeletonema_menzelii.AAC.5